MNVICRVQDGHLVPIDMQDEAVTGIDHEPELWGYPETGYTILCTQRDWDSRESAKSWWEHLDFQTPEA